VKLAVSAKSQNIFKLSICIKIARAASRTFRSADILVRSNVKKEAFRSHSEPWNSLGCCGLESPRSNRSRRRCHHESRCALTSILKKFRSKSIQGLISIFNAPIRIRR
jgi:hypothetical protein